MFGDVMLGLVILTITNSHRSNAFAEPAAAAATSPSTMSHNLDVSGSLSPPIVI